MSVGKSHLSLINNVFDTSPPITYPSGPATLPLTEIPLPHPSGSRPLPEWWSRWKAAMEQQRSGRNLLWKAVPAVGGGFVPASVSTAFEGIDADDLEGLPTTLRENFNAYESIAPSASGGLFFGPSNTTANYFTTLTPEATVLLTYLGLHRTTERRQVGGLSVRPTRPTRKLSTFTNKETDGSLGRGILFVRDLMHEGSRGTNMQPFLITGTIGTKFDLCVGDFRLSPGSRQAGSVANVQGMPPDLLNPLVDNGFPFVDAADAFLYSDPVVGIINPVGTYLDINAQTPNVRWLDLDLTASFGVWLGSSLSNDSALDGGWCFLATQGQPSFQQPTSFASWGTGTNALRVSCEWYGGTGLGDPWLLGNDSNLQSFMVWR